MRGRTVAVVVGLVGLLVVGVAGLVVWSDIRDSDDSAAVCGAVKHDVEVVDGKAERLASTIGPTVTVPVTYDNRTLGTAYKPEVKQLALLVERKAILVDQNDKCFSAEDRAEAEQSYRQWKAVLDR